MAKRVANGARLCSQPASQRAARQRSAVGYLRRSTDRQEQSIPDQKRAVERFADEQGLRLVHHYLDDAISGASTVGRRAFQQMIDDAQQDSCAFGSIIVYDVKRFGRVDNDEAGYYRHLLRVHGVEVLYATEGFDGGEADDLLRPVKQWQARQESRDLSKVTIRGLISKFAPGSSESEHSSSSGGASGGGAGGGWMGGVPPHGYDLRYENERGEFLFVLRYLPDGSKHMIDEKGVLIRTLARRESLNISKRDRARLAPGDPQRVAVVKRIFRMYVQEHKGLTAIADTLNRESVPTPRGPEWSHIYSGKWANATIRSILVNPLYTGDMVWNRRSDGRFHRISNGQAVERKQIHGARLEPNDESDWMVARNAHEALISRRLFESARSIRKSKPSSKQQRGRSRRASGGWTGARARFILSGLIRCAACGNRYQGWRRTKSKRRKDGSKVVNAYYACGGYIRQGRSVCQINSVPQQKLEDLVIETVLEYYGRYEGEEGRRLLAEVVRVELGSDREDLADARKRAEDDRATIESTIRNLLDNISAGTREMVEQRLEELQAERAVLDRRLEELELVASEQRDVKSIVSEALGFLTDLPYTLRHGRPAEKRAVLLPCIEGVCVNVAEGRIEVAVRWVPGAPGIDHNAEGGAETIRRAL